MSLLRNESVRTALAAVTSELILEGNSCWRFALVNGEPHIVTVNIDGDWLLLDADYSGQTQGPELFWEAAVHNDSLEGPAKLVLAHNGSLRLRAELPLLEGVDLAGRVRETCRGFEAGWKHAGDPSSRVASPAGEAEPMDLKILCAEAGWPFVERSGRRLAVELEVQGGFCQALLVPAGHGAHISCEVATLGGLADECRPAIGGLLLATSGLVRMGRASVNTNGASPVAQLEVVFGTPPSPLEISSALECLSIACSLCGEEIKTLQSPAIAERYLALRGWAANTAGRQNERTVTP